MSSPPSPARSQPRQRLSRENRLAQLLGVAWKIVREQGTEALTLGHLAEQAGVTKPVVYDHFPDRPALLCTLYQDFDERQTALFDAALQHSEASAEAKAWVIANAYVDCVLQQGREIAGVLAALSSSPELARVKQAYEAAFMDKCRAVLAPFIGNRQLSTAHLRAMLGAAEALSDAAASAEVSPSQAKAELYEVIVSMLSRAR
ncbi:TetR/AcrR family transcriptional regulator [Pseudomonas ovata]|uniref:TetR/AcrR family transcriptional regulator n=1 Tax=Pseudomonas ovata TaxID=1839709 RepID=UPI000D691992|nr:TetR/AcrR family transcriptional regulator [Pseudomonas ovata]